MISSPEPDAAQDIWRSITHRRAVEAIIWGIPAVNYLLMAEEASRRVQCAPNEIVYWSRLLDGRNQTLTPNPDAVYLMPFLNTTDGPVVLEIPPAGDVGAIIGTLMDAWQVPLEDVGKAGVDRGAGGKYLVLPPGYDAAVPDGYIVLPAQTYAAYARSSIAGGSDEQVAAAVESANRSRSTSSPRPRISHRPCSTTPRTPCETPRSRMTWPSTRPSTGSSRPDPGKPDVPDGSRPSRLTVLSGLGELLGSAKCSSHSFRRTGAVHFAVEAVHMVPDDQLISVRAQ